MTALWKPLSIVGGLLLLLTYFFSESRSLDLVLRERMHEGLRALALHDAELTREVLRARAGLTPNYDALTRTAMTLRASLRALQQETTAVWGDAGGDIERHVDALATVLQEKLVLVEHFKSDNALLRNSSTYFTHATQVLEERYRARGDGPPAAVTALSQAVLRFMQSPGEPAGQEARRALEHVSRVPALRVDGEALALVTHGGLIVEVLPEVDALLHQIVGAPIMGHAEAVQDVVLRHSNRIEARAQVFRVLLYLVAVLLLGYLLYQFGRLRAGARALHRANLELEREIVERRRAADALRTSEERFRAITESANDAIISADRRGHIVSWNARAEAIYGYQADEVLGTSLVRLIPERYHRAYEARFAAWAAAGTFPLAGQTVEFTGRRRDGSEFPLEISFSTWSTAQGHYVTGMVRDLSIRKRLEETTRQQELQLIQASKMTALGTLVSGVAHEINNPNQLVLMNATLLRSAWDDALPVLDAHRQEQGEFRLAGLAYAEMRANVPALLREVQDGARRIERIVRDLKDFARPPGGGTRKPYALNDAVQRALRLLSHSIRTRTGRFEVVLAGDVPMMVGDVQQVEQVVVNLVINALEALPDRERGVRVTTAFDPAERAVVLEVRDEGVGIPADHLARLCDPFFTTKRESGGTGLGLAITSTLVRGHGGRLTFSSEPGRGTSAVVRFPLACDADQPAGHTAASSTGKALVETSWPT
jgi:PAS domain S-box-containing protein